MSRKVREEQDRNEKREEVLFHMTSSLAKSFSRLYLQTTRRSKRTSSRTSIQPEKLVGTSTAESVLNNHDNGDDQQPRRKSRRLIDRKSEPQDDEGNSPGHNPVDKMLGFERVPSLVADLVKELS